MKKFALLGVVLILPFAACQRHSAEETAPLHEKHGHHEKAHPENAAAPEHGESHDKAATVPTAPVEKHDGATAH